MCGIAGILRVHPPHSRGSDVPPPEVAIPEAWLDTLDDSIKHRGPDGRGRFRDRARRPDGSTVDIALVHRRLAIIDPACGHQPMVSERGKDGEGLVAVVFNGCIYNHRELRRELTAAGRSFETDHSDTEVLIHGWRQHGQSLFDRLESMFAAGIWDRTEASLVLARDRFGEKPLYFCRQRFGPSAATAFSSVPSGLLRLWSRWRRDDQTQVLGVFWEEWVATGYGNAAGLPVLSVNEMSPGTSAPVTFHGVGPASHFAMPASEPDPDRRVRVLTPDRVDALIERAVRRRLESDVPLGIFLSGGIDSSLIALKARKALGRVSTFCVRMPDPAYDESDAAERVAHLIGTEHQTLECHPRPSEDLVRLVRQLGLPFGDSSLLPTHWVSAAARQHVPVALGGEGGDEFFAGYERYQVAEPLQRWRGVLSRIPLWALPESNPRSRLAKLARLCRAARGDGYLDLVRIFPRTEVETMLGCTLSEVAPAIAKIMKELPLGGAMAWDQQFYLPHDLLRKLDTASMAVALEVRAPLLDSQLTGAVLEHRAQDLMPRGQRKGLLRQVARKYLPADIVDRPKQGFAIPIGEWFRTDYGGMRQLLLDHLNSAEPWGPPRLGIDLNMAFVRRMLDEHMDRRRDHSQRLYMLLVLSIWAKWLGSLGSGRG